MEESIFPLDVRVCERVSVCRVSFGFPCPTLNGMKEKPKFLTFPRDMGVFGTCDECNKEKEGPLGDPFYCHDCWEEDNMFSSLKSFRCFTFAAVYSLKTGERLGVGASIGTCAERDALWKIDDVDTPKAVMVCRLRKNRNDRNTTYGGSKPCSQCIVTFQFYNVQRVCYSENGGTFCWDDVSTLTNDYKSQCDTIVLL